jgi:hypothetical protein
VRVLIHAADMPMPADPLFHLTSGIAPTLDEMIARTALVIGVRRKRIALPGFFWKLVNTIIWCGPLRRVLPHDLKVMFWRLSLITSDGFVGASIHFSKVFPHRFVDLGAMLEATYGLMSRGLDRDQ